MARLKAPQLTSRAQFEQVINEIATCEVRKRRLAAKRDAKIQAIQEEFQPEEARVQGELDGLLVLAEKYAEDHRDELFPKETKSAETSLARFGFRYGNPTLALLNRKCTWDGVNAALKVLGFASHVRSVEEVDKDGIKNAKFSEQTLKAMGLKITQSETFFIEPKLEDAETVRA
jgi:phage host-nuclease inhibitor protein Gam